MARKKLIAYIKEQLRNGYSLSKIKNVLIDYGYREHEVDEAINEIYRPKEVKHTIHFSPAAIITIIAVAFIIVSGIFAFSYFGNRKTPQQLLDLNLEGIIIEAKQGEDIIFIADILNLGSASRYDIFLRHELINAKTNEIVTYKEETRGIETAASKQTRIQVPDDAVAGSYVLRTIARYNGNRAVATLQVKVTEKQGKVSEGEKELKPEAIKEETCFDNIQNQNEEGIDCGGICEPCKAEIIEEVLEVKEKPIAEEPKEEPIEEKPLSQLSTFDTLEQVKSIAQSNPKKAEELCAKLQFETSKDLCYNNIAEIRKDRYYCDVIKDNRTKDICYSNIAKALKNSNLCEEISTDNRKDSCYMNFVIDFNDYTVCNKVINQYLRQSCESLRQLSENSAINISFFIQAVNQSLIEII